MTEGRAVLQGRKISYTGLFDGKEIYQMIREKMADKGYDDWIVKKHTEKRGKNGKQVEIKYLPTSTVNDYTKIQVKIEILYKDLKRTSVKYKGKKIDLDEGSLEIVFSGFLLTDIWGRWDSSADLFFLRTIMDKFIFWRQTAKYESMVKDHIEELYNYIRKYLNTTKTD